MSSHLLVTVFTGLMLIVATAARSQSTSAPASTPAMFEVTPHLALGSGASSGAGAAITWPVGRSFSVDFEMGYRRAEMNALNASVGLLFDLPSIGPVTPYLVGGVGLDQYATATGSPATGVLVRSATAMSLNAGGGVRVPLTENVGLRTDARWSNGIGSNAPERWRIYNGITFRKAN
jgi:hypothetical protein